MTAPRRKFALLGTLLIWSGTCLAQEPVTIRTPGPDQQSSAPALPVSTGSSHTVPISSDTLLPPSSSDTILPPSASESVPAGGVESQPVVAAASLPPVAVHPPAPRRAKVERVVDGDTLLLDTGDRVRVLYINTPEKKEKYGPESGDFTRQFLQYKEVDLVYSARSERDGYGRLLAEVYVDGKSLEEAIIAEGLAHVFLIAPDPNTEMGQRLLSVQQQARQAGKGIWGTERYSSTLHITSYHANGRGNDSENPNVEYLRIANITDQPVNVKGYSLTSENGRIFILPEIIIPAGYSFQVYSGIGIDQLDPEKGSIKVYWDSKYPIWRNDGDSAVLRDEKGHLVDTAVYAPKMYK